MRVALFVTCLVDLMRPSVGFAALRLLEAAGCEVFVPESQTCCGQPAASAGEQALAIQLAKKNIGELENFDYVVIPSGSCADHMRNAYPLLLAGDVAWSQRATALAARVFELTSFLVDVIGISVLPSISSAKVTYHDSCKGLRRLGIKRQPRQLMAMVDGLQLVEMPDAEECCGFGGAFSESFGEVSTAIVDRKCSAVVAVSVDTVVGGDLGCLLNIEGRMRRRGDENTRVMHIAELLAGGE